MVNLFCLWGIKRNYIAGVMSANDPKRTLEPIKLRVVLFARAAPKLGNS